MTTSDYAPSDPGLLFVAWTQNVGRSHEIASALGGEAFTTHPERLAGRRLVLARYLVNAFRTIKALRERRPDVVIVTNPPLVAALVVWAWSKTSRANFILDSHPSAFGAKDHIVSRRLIRVHRFLARRALTCMVTTRDWVDVLNSWGADGVIVHEAPPLWPSSRSTSPSAPAAEANRVLFPGVFAGDEPIEQVVELARLRPEFEIRVTGNERKCPASILADLPPNVTLLGYLGSASYAAEVQTANAVLALTTEPTSVMRAAYEAVYARRPLVISDWPAGREAFRHATYVQNQAEDMARGVDEALGSCDQARLDAALTEQERTWRQQLHHLRAARLRSHQRRSDRAQPATG